MSGLDRIERLRAAKRGVPANVAGAAPVLRRQLEAEQQGTAAEVTEADRIQARRLLAILEIAFLAAAADGELSDVEIVNLGNSISSWLGGEISVENIATVLDRFAAVFADQGFEARLGFAAEALDPEGAREAYTLSCILLACDTDVREEELGALGDIADALQIPEEEAQARFDEIHDAIQDAAASLPA